MPSWELFEQQSEEYKESVLPKNIRKRLAVEAASHLGWHKYVGLDGEIISMDGFGASAPRRIIIWKIWFYSRQCSRKSFKINEVDYETLGVQGLPIFIPWVCRA